MPELTEEQWTEIEAKYLSGISMHELARQYPTSRTAIRAHLRRHGFAGQTGTPPTVEIPVHVLKKVYCQLFACNKDAAQALRKYLPKSCMNDVFDQKWGI